MSDDYFVEESRMAQGSEECPYISKQWNYVLDNNAGSYGSNVLRFDLGQIYNAQKFVVAKEMYIQIPIVMELTQAGNFALTRSDYAMGLKNGYYTLIDSMTTIYDGQTVEQDCRHKTFYTSFKMHTSLSLNDERILGPTIGYAKDSSLSVKYTATNTATVNGCGLLNNLTNWAAYATDSGNGTYSAEPINTGLLQRQKDTSFGADKGFFGLDEAAIQRSGKNYCKFTNGATEAEDRITYFITATIRLRDISSFFDNLPLVKGMYGRLEIRMNLGSLKLTKTAATQNYLTANVDCQFPNEVCPFMVCPPSIGAHLSQTALVAGIYIAKPGQSIAGATNHANFAQADNHELQQCRLYYPQVELQPAKSIAYSQANSNKLIEYEDAFYVPYVATAQSSFDFQITNSIQNPTALLMIPILNDLTLNPCLSPFTTEPATTSPMGLVNFQVKLAGANVWNSNRTYDWELFNSELYGVNSINGGQEVGLSNGLINYTDYQNNYKYIYVNLERRLTDNTSFKSISISGRNPHSTAIQYHIFVLSKKRVHIDVESGKLKDMVQIA